MKMLLLNRAETEKLLDSEAWEALVEHLSAGFRALSSGQVMAPPRVELQSPPHGFLLAMPAYQADEPLAVKLVTVFAANEGKGLPSHQGLICLFDAGTGTPLALMDGAYVTAIRTAAASALSARLLARQDARVLAIVGAGVQGHTHLQLVGRARGFDQIRIASRRRESAEELAATVPSGVAIDVVGTAREAVDGADVVCLCTSAATPVIEADWLSAGTHVTSVGYAPPGSEVPGALIQTGRLFVETRQAFSPPPAGCIELAGLDPEQGIELGEVLLGRRPGRQTAEELTLYKSMGHAMEDLVAAGLAYRRAGEQGRGIYVDW
jgi:ornithine cyclodeaminase/alanine dehydrogenase-like protein (mu-crystallin family)